MNSAKCFIKLDNQYNIYYTGTVINGIVHLEFDAPKKVRAIIIRFIGRARTKILKKDSGESLIGQDNVMDKQYELFQNKDPDSVISPGVYEYSFICHLPPFLPSSFEGKYGHVRYTIEVTLDIPWRVDQYLKKPFTVLTTYDLNVEPQLKEKFELELEKNVCCLWCQSGPVTIVTSIPKTGFVPRELIPITCEYNNRSKASIYSLEFIMIKRIIFRAEWKRKHRTEKVATFKVNELQSHKSQTLSVQLQVPSLTPSNSKCRIISFDYFLKIECNVGKYHQTLEGLIPITIGTVPIIDDKSMQ